MNRWTILVSVAALILIVGAGCSNSKSKDKVPPALASYASPGGGLYENTALPMSVALSANKAGAIIYYTSGGSPADPTFASSVYDAATPISIDASYADGTFVIKHFAFLEDAVFGTTELEDPFKTATYFFKEDIHPPTVVISPNGGSYGDPSDVNPITITATDAHDAAPDLTIKYTTTEDGSTPEDPRTSGSALTGTGDGVPVTWSGGTLKIKAVAYDLAGNVSSVKSATFTIDNALAAQKVLELINADRQTNAVDPLTWNSAWAEACAGHSEQVYLGREAGTLVKLDTVLVTWYNDDDSQHRQLLNFDGDPSTGVFSSAQAVGMGIENCDSATEFYNMIVNNTDIETDPDITEFGCGFKEDVWEAMWTYNP